jgi:hypothetical protein
MKKLNDLFKKTFALTALLTVTFIFGVPFNELGMKLSAQTTASANDYASLQAAIAGAATTINITGNIVYPNLSSTYITINKDCTIQPVDGSFTITQPNADTRHFNITGNSNVIIGGNENYTLTLDGGSVGGGIDVYSSNASTAKLTLNSGAIIQNCHGTNHLGGGIYFGGDVLTINAGAIITGNVTQWEGGGIACVGNATVNIFGGSILGNTTYFEGGGIFCDSFTTLNIQNGIIIGNIADRKSVV